MFLGGRYTPILLPHLFIFPPSFVVQVVKLGSTAVAEALLAAGANPDVRDPVLSLTVTHDAAREGFVDTVSVLMRHGANVNLADERGNLPLHLAAGEGHLRVVHLLIGRTANPRTSNGQGYTAGQLARLRRRMDTAIYIDEYLSSREYILYCKIFFFFVRNVSRYSNSRFDAGKLPGHL